MSGKMPCQIESSISAYNIIITLVKLSTSIQIIPALIFVAIVTNQNTNHQILRWVAPDQCPSHAVDFEILCSWKLHPEVLVMWVLHHLSIFKKTCHEISKDYQALISIDRPLVCFKKTDRMKFWWSFNCYSSGTFPQPNQTAWVFLAAKTWRFESCVAYDSPYATGPGWWQWAPWCVVSYFSMVSHYILRLQE